MSYNYCDSVRGRPGFDVDYEADGACRAIQCARKINVVKNIVANESDFFAQGELAHAA